MNVSCPSFILSDVRRELHKALLVVLFCITAACLPLLPPLQLLCSRHQRPTLLAAAVSLCTLTACTLPPIRTLLLTFKRTRANLHTHHTYMQSFWFTHVHRLQRTNTPTHAHTHLNTYTQWPRHPTPAHAPTHTWLPSSRRHLLWFHSDTLLIDVWALQPSESVWKFCRLGT